MLFYSYPNDNVSFPSTQNNPSLLTTRPRGNTFLDDADNERASSRRRAACHARENAAAAGVRLRRNSALVCVVSEEAVGSGEDWISEKRSIAESLCE
jgi:hypothetical protein